MKRGKHRLDSSNDGPAKRVRCLGCHESGCSVLYPRYNIQSTKTGMYCSKHKKPEMVNVRDPVCIHPGCTKRSRFNVPEIKKGLYCVEHKLPEMINVKDPVCQSSNPGCNTRAGFGFVGCKPTACRDHSQPGMISHPKRKCEVEHCPEYARYGIRTTPERCEQHKTLVDLDLVLKPCPSCFQLDIMGPGDGSSSRAAADDMICSTCSGVFVRVRLGRQKQVLAHFVNLPLLNEKLKGYDKALCKIDADFTNCGKERPDFLFDAGTHFVIVEVDEDQHHTYPPECDMVRMKNITEALGRPCFWIRYNPDEYQGISIKIRDRHRLHYLSQVVNQALAMIPRCSQDVLRIVYLFYDGFQIKQPLEIQTIQLDAPRGSSYRSP